MIQIFDRKILNQNKQIWHKNVYQPRKKAL